MLQQLKNIHYHNELLEILFNNKSGLFASNVASPLVAIYMLFDYLSPIILLSLVLPLFLMGYLRYSISKKALLSLKKEDTNNTQKYLKQTLLLIFLSAILLGISTYLTIQETDPIQASFMIVFMFVLLAGSISTITCVFHAYLLFNIPIILIVLLSIIQLDGTIYTIATIIIIIYPVITFPASYRIYQSLKNNIEKNILIKQQQDQLLANQAHLLQSEKMVSLGEMIGNIAHQWRQPLSSISVSATSAIVEKQMGVLNDDALEKKLENINQQAQYLSETIDIFRNFIRDEKTVQNVIIQENIQTAINIVQSSLKEHHIELITKIPQEHITTKITTGEVPQVIINIINNAKDILIEKQVDCPIIQLNLYTQENTIIITIEDNGGGVPEHILPRIFEPYFTTKHKSKGTGLGLHMSYLIIDNLNGTLQAINENNGAKFIITLPIIQ
ncbi:MAG TPA: GHKL domain-containing protein [Arcobacter sp.]|nr:GHKL domain-containing protein [Arcobacter sp.]